MSIVSTPPSYQYDTAIFITRAQPFHSGHKQNVELALRIARQVIVIVGSCGGARDIRNPFTFAERKDMIVSAFPNAGNRLQVEPHRDYPYNDNIWASYVQKIVDKHAPKTHKVAIVGHRKEDTAYYLDMFPQWEFVSCPQALNFCATDVRHSLFKHRITGDESGKWVPFSTQKFLKSFLEDSATSGIADTLINEFNYIAKYRKSWEAAPYPPIFVTADALVVQSGHILLIKRKAAPGMGLWAICGGFLEQKERIVDGMIRELLEETKIKVPEKILRGSIVGSKTYDYPNRSLRGRVITHAYLINLPDGPLSKVKGADDAERAAWIPISDIYQMQDQFFEDHWYIIDDLIHTMGRTK